MCYNLMCLYNILQTAIWGDLSHLKMSFFNNKNILNIQHIIKIYTFRILTVIKLIIIFFLNT